MTQPADHFQNIAGTNSGFFQISKGGPIYYANATSDPTTPTPTEGSRYFNSNTDQARIYYNGSWQNISIGAGVTNVMQLNIDDNTNNAAYTVVGGDIIYGGSSVWGVPIEILVTARRNSGNFDLRLFDQTQGLVIAERTGLSGASTAIFDLGSLGINNIPTGQALWEIQAKRVGGGGGNRVFVGTLSMRF